MKILEVYLRNELLFEYLVQLEQITIGRVKRNHIILPYPSVSREHAKILIEDDNVIIVDTSSGGTFVNNERVVNKRSIIRDDKIDIGPYALFLREPERAHATFEREDTISGATLYIPEQASPQINKSFLAHQASITVLNGFNKGKRFLIKKEKYSFGKEQDNDLILLDEFISRHHGEIRFRNGEFFIRDLGSKNGIFIGGKRILGTTLTSHTRIEIGKCNIEFSIKDADLSSSDQEGQLGKLIGKSKRIRDIYTLVKKAASFDATVLVSGESGTGKGLVVQTIHSISDRASKPFITVDCGSIPHNLIESELFGHEKGAFTGVQNKRIGAFEQADSGTVFLDEIGELPSEMQPKLLRILEEKEFKRVGGNKYISTNIRVIAATNKDLSKEVSNGKFRNDLFYRLYVIPIQLPPLRERKEDIPLLAEYFINQSLIMREKKIIFFSEDALTKLMSYSWPGNVRELRNVMDRALIHLEGDLITSKDIELLPMSNMENQGTLSSGISLEEVERQTIIETLKSQGGNKKATAKILGIAYSTMCEKVKKYKIEI